MATEPAAAATAEATNNTGIAEAQALAEETRTGDTKGKEVYASGLPASYNEEEFRKVFEKYCTKGTISHCRFRKHVVGTQTGYGFLTFTNEQDGKDAIQQMNGKTLEGELVKVTDSASPSYSRSKTNLYIEGLPTDWNEERVKQLFSQFGTITEARVLINRKTNQKTGVGFIHFKTTEEAESAINGLNGSMADENAQKPLSIRFAKVMGRRGGGKRTNRGGNGNRRGGYGGGFHGGYGFGGQFGGYNMQQPYGGYGSPYGAWGGGFGGYPNGGYARGYGPY